MYKKGNLLKTELNKMFDTENVRLGTVRKIIIEGQLQKCIEVVTWNVKLLKKLYYADMEIEDVISPRKEPIVILKKRPLKQIHIFD